MILFVQPFGLGSPGGGSRILRALLENAPAKWLSVAATPFPPPTSPFGKEIHIPGRPYFGRLERTRFSHWFTKLDGWAGVRLELRLNHIIKQERIKAIHAVAHGCWDTLAAYRVAKLNGLPFFLTVHDDPAYSLRGHPLREKLLTEIVECWREAKARFVISEEMGQELCRRWGKRDYHLVTDGLVEIAPQPRPQPPNRLSVYFMGLLHISYEPNFIALQEALHLVSENDHGMEVRLMLRGAMLRHEAMVQPELVCSLPFAKEEEVHSDLENVELLYQPLAIEPESHAMNAFSLSTKMITYLGSGLPILFHGPVDSAAGKLLGQNRAAFVCDSNEPSQLAKILIQAFGSERNEVVSSALKLANRQFLLRDLRDRFWNAILTK
jgi:glycosyltransferase involved in cell wall biosynthesis